MSDSIALTLAEEGFSQAAVSHALAELAKCDPNSIRDHLRWARRVAERADTEGTPWTPCEEDGCLSGWRETGPREVERCKCHPAFLKKGARGR